MLFLIKSSNSLRFWLIILLSLCCLGQALSAKLSKKVEQQNQVDKAPQTVAEVAAEVIEQAVSAAVDDDEENDDNENDDDDDDDDEAANDKNAAAAAAADDNADKADAEKETTAAATAENAVKPADVTDLSVWGMVRTLWSWLRSDLSESLFGDDDDKPAAAAASSVGEGRTFGKIRRLQMALVPIIFKFGVLSAMVAFLVAIGMKSLFLLKILVAMNAIAILGKFLTLKTNLFGQYENSAPHFNYPGWNPHAKESWGVSGPAAGPPHGPPTKEIHLHIHGNPNAQAQLASQAYSNYDTQGWASRSDPYGAYAPTAQATPYAEAQGEFPNNTDPMSVVGNKYAPVRQTIR